MSIINVSLILGIMIIFHLLWSKILNLLQMKVRYHTLDRIEVILYSSCLSYFGQYTNGWFGLVNIFGLSNVIWLKNESDN